MTKTKLTKTTRKTLAEFAFDRLLNPALTKRALDLHDDCIKAIQADLLTFLTTGVVAEHTRAVVAMGEAPLRVFDGKLGAHSEAQADNAMIDGISIGNTHDIRVPDGHGGSISGFFGVPKITKRLEGAVSEWSTSVSATMQVVPMPKLPASATLGCGAAFRVSWTHPRHYDSDGHTEGHLLEARGNQFKLKASVLPSGHKVTNLPDWCSSKTNDLFHASCLASEHAITERLGLFNTALSLIRQTNTFEDLCELWPEAKLAEGDVLATTSGRALVTVTKADIAALQANAKMRGVSV